MRRILITGGAGFIGYHLSVHHLRLGDEVVIFDNHWKDVGRRDAAFRELINAPAVTTIEADLTQPLPPTICDGDFDIVYHLAAINGTELFYEIPFQVARSNTLITINLLDWLATRSFGRLVYTSTSEVYAGCEPVGLLTIPTDESIPVVFPQPTNVRFSYGTSKFLGEFLCLQFARERQLAASVVRYHNIYGPRMGHRHVIPQFIERLLAGESPLQVYGAKETRAFCYIGDAVEATYRVAVTEACQNEVIHVGNSMEEVSIGLLAKRLMTHTGRNIELADRGAPSGSVGRRCPDISKLTRLTGFVPRVMLDEGLAQTVEWYKQNLPAAS